MFWWFDAERGVSLDEEAPLFLTRQCQRFFALMERRVGGRLAHRKESRAGHHAIVTPV